MRGAMLRDTRSVVLAPTQRFNHYPATPMCTISWWFSGEGQMLAPGAPALLESPRVAIASSIVFGGPFTRPSITWSPGPSHGMMLLLLPDAVHQLTGIEPMRWMNQMVNVEEVLPTNWLAMCKQVARAVDDEQRFAHIEAFFAPIWSEVRAAQAFGLHRYTDWANELALRAATTQTGRSLRQIERRIRLWAGQPMRELKGFGRAERAFFSAMEASENASLQWSGVAADTGFSDQSHLCRESRRITGCSPAELWERIAHDEGFWPYRVWQ